MNCTALKSIIINSDTYFNPFLNSNSDSRLYIEIKDEISIMTVKSIHEEMWTNHADCGDFVSILPREVCQRIFSYFDLETLTKLSIVNKSWYSLSRDNWLYKRLLKAAHWGMFAYSQSTSGCNSKCYKCLENEVKCFNGDESYGLSENKNSNSLVNWYEEFKKQYQIHRNWLKGRYKKRIFSGHTSVVHCVVFNDQRIISGSADSTIKVWNLHTNAQWSVQTLPGHSEAVRCLQLLHCPESPSEAIVKNNDDLFFGQKCPRDIQIVSGSNDKTIKIWALAARNDWSSIVCRATLIGHSDSVRCLQADHDKIVSGSYDTTLKIWCIVSGKLKNTLRGHLDAILCVQYDDSVIVSGSLDKTIKVWLFTGECLCSLDGHVKPVACLHLDYKCNRIISGSHDNTLKFWDIANRKCIRTIDWKENEGHKHVIRCLQADHYRFVSGSDDKTIKVWDIESGIRLHTYQGHEDGVSCLQFNNDMLVSGSYDHSVILWDFSAC